MVLWFLMFAFAILSIVLEAVLIHLLNSKIPSLFKQREEGERIIGNRIFKEISGVKNELEAYFKGIRWTLNWILVLYTILTFVIFLLFNGLIYSIPMSPPKPGPLVISQSVVSLLLTLISTSYGWLKIILDYSDSRMLKRELIDKYVILGVPELSD